MKSWLEAGIKVLPVIPSTAFAKMMERIGASACDCRRMRIRRSYRGTYDDGFGFLRFAMFVHIPVLAAGGIGDGRGIAASFALGACGVQVGTRFLVAKECTVHQNYKNKILKAKDIDTIATGKRLGHPVRALKNPFSREFFSKEYDCTISNEELEKFGAGALRLAAVEGDEQKGSFLAGQISGMIQKEQSAEEIIKEMFEQAETVLRNATKWVK
jgi:enoyl-[acyl-carrier protein] reductase II